MFLIVMVTPFFFQMKPAMSKFLSLIEVVMVSFPLYTDNLVTENLARSRKHDMMQKIWHEAE